MHSPYNDTKVTEKACEILQSLANLTVAISITYFDLKYIIYIYIPNSPKLYWISMIHLAEFNLSKIRKLFKIFMWGHYFSLLKKVIRNKSDPAWVTFLHVLGKLSLSIYLLLDTLVFLSFVMVGVIPKEYVQKLQYTRNSLALVKVILMLSVNPKRLYSLRPTLHKLQESENKLKSFPTRKVRVSENTKVRLKEKLREIKYLYWDIRTDITTDSIRLAMLSADMGLPWGFLFTGPIFGMLNLVCALLGFMQDVRLVKMQRSANRIKIRKCLTRIKKQRIHAL